MTAVARKSLARSGRAASAADLPQDVAAGRNLPQPVTAIRGASERKPLAFQAAVRWHAACNALPWIAMTQVMRPVFPTLTY